MSQPDKTYGIPEGDIDFISCRASGHGGQYVNTTDSAVQLRFRLSSSILSDEMRERLKKQAPNQITDDGLLLIEARTERSQIRNREIALQKLNEMLVRASRKPKTRRPTRPTLASKERRLSQKRRNAEIKRNRRKSDD